jgi:glycosyltransferase involved in cell wall biosynthesis
MRILLSSPHHYPADDGSDSSFQPRAFPSGAPFVVHDLLAKGLAELGHEVFYLVEGWDGAIPPSGIRLTRDAVEDVDIFHNTERERGPWVRTQHRFADELEGRSPPHNWIYVSRSLAMSHQGPRGLERVVLNGIDPSGFTYSETKGDYILFLAGMQGPRDQYAYLGKGLDIALQLSRSVGFPLIVAGTARRYETIARVSEMCRESGATYVGDVRGPRKAELLAGAKALLFPTRLNEGCPLVIAEALISGTPVISSTSGPCPELVTADVGFACANREEYMNAIERIDTVPPQACRHKALKDFHYLRMAAEYVKEYEREIASS